MQLRPITAIAVLLLVVASLLVAGCTTTRNEQTTQSNSYVPTNAPASTTTVRVTATSLGTSNIFATSYGTPTAAATGNKFVTYAVYLNNINAKDIQMGNPLFFKLRDTDGNIYSYETYGFNMKPQQVNGVTLKYIMEELNTQPGDKLSGLIVFQIPTSATPKSLTYDDYTNKITINL
jgi:Domain of unknown function (DUF4352)